VEAQVEMPLNRWLLLRGLEQEKPDSKPESTVEAGWTKWLLPNGLHKGPDRRPVTRYVMLWAAKPQNSHSGPFPRRRAETPDLR
jgi:hypothetical protein